MKPATKYFLAAIAIVSLGIACHPPNAPDIVIVNSNNNTNTNTTGGGSGTGGGGATTHGQIVKAEVHQFGQSCPSGTAPTTASRSVAIGCTALLTCSPYDANGEIKNASEQGMKPDFFGAFSGSATVEQLHGEEPFNLDAKGKVSGLASFRCIVAGVSSEQFDLQVGS